MRSPSTSSIHLARDVCRACAPSSTSRSECSMPQAAFAGRPGGTTRLASSSLRCERRHHGAEMTLRLPRGLLFQQHPTGAVPRSLRRRRFERGVDVNVSWARSARVTAPNPEPDRSPPKSDRRLVAEGGYPRTAAYRRAELEEIANARADGRFNEPPAPADMPVAPALPVRCGAAGVDRVPKTRPGR